MVNLDYLYNPETAKPSFDKNYFIDKKLGFRTIENGMILPHKDNGRGGLKGALGGIVDSNGNYVENSFVYELSKDKSYTPPPKN